jgi:hypothetical protein
MKILFLIVVVQFLTLVVFAWFSRVVLRKKPVMVPLGPTEPEYWRVIRSCGILHVHFMYVLPQQKMPSLEEMKGRIEQARQARDPIYEILAATERRAAVNPFERVGRSSRLELV